MSDSVLSFGCTSQYLPIWALFHGFYKIYNGFKDDSKTKVTKIGYSWKIHHGRVCFFSISSTAANTGPHLGHHSLSRRSLHGLWSIWSWGTSCVALKMAESGPTTSHNSRMMHRTFHGYMSHNFGYLLSWEVRIDFLGLNYTTGHYKYVQSMSKEVTKTYKNIILQWPLHYIFSLWYVLQGLNFRSEAVTTHFQLQVGGGVILASQWKTDGQRQIASWPQVYRDNNKSLKPFSCPIFKESHGTR